LPHRAEHHGEEQKYAKRREATAPFEEARVTKRCAYGGDEQRKVRRRCEEFERLRDEKKT
jgi:hypothetical protein